MITARDMGNREAKPWGTEEEESRLNWARVMQGQCMQDARAPHPRCVEDPVGLTLAATQINRSREVERGEGGGEPCAYAV